MTMKLKDEAGLLFASEGGMQVARTGLGALMSTLIARLSVIFMVFSMHFWILRLNLNLMCLAH